MPIPQTLFRFALHLQTFHGWDVRVLYIGRTMPGRKGRWVVRIPATGAKFEGAFKPALAWLQGYQAGYLGGRRYTREESGALLHEAKSFINERVVTEVAAARQGAS